MRLAAPKSMGGLAKDEARAGKFYKKSSENRSSLGMGLFADALHRLSITHKFRT
jgi:hypothetical protein